MKTDDIRSLFVSFFAEQGHKVVPSASLIPENDLTLLFVNAGMVPFKDIFLGDASASYTRATSVQRCMRAGGKHNDLDNVGYTARHHTFFEMMGNFSFGDYFKREAITMAWQFLTKELGLPPEKLWVTVFEDDDEAASIWLDGLGISPERFSRCGAVDNFWSMGDTGPCGPCSEIFYDHGPDIPGGPPGSEDADADRYIEIWNLVFMQYNRLADGSMEPLPKPSVDTGMGLERIAAVMQGVHNNYDTDIFSDIIAVAGKLLKCQDLSHHALRVIADHLRSACFLIVDGVLPSNEGRGYVLRRIIRRALRHGHQLSNRVDFMHQLVPTFIDVMGQAYPELDEFQVDLIAVLRREEQQFGVTLAKGMQLLNMAMLNAEDDVLSGDVAFQLYDTYGFPVDLTQDIAKEKFLSVDMDGFEKALADQRRRSQQSSQFSVDYNVSLGDLGESSFVGYTQMECSAQVMFLANAEVQVDKLSKGEQGILVLDQTPFYPEGGGQVGDQGAVTWDGGVFSVFDTKRHGEAILHFGEIVKGELKAQQSVIAKVDVARHSIKCHHTATHLLHASLRSVLGDNVSQRGSLVTPDRLRFDFSYDEAMTSEQLQSVETMINQIIRQDIAVESAAMPIDQAKSKGAMALFGEKYGDDVRVITVGDFSMELCGGTHVNRTGEIGLLKIVSEESVAQGVRRIEALAAARAMDWINERLNMLDVLNEKLKVAPAGLLDRVDQLVQANESATKSLKVFEMRSLQDNIASLLPKAKLIGNVKVLVESLPEAKPSALRDGVDQLKRQAGSDLVAVLLSEEQGKLALVIGVSKSLSAHLSAGDLMRHVVEEFGGKGGGRPDLAQGGGVPASESASLREYVGTWVESNLKDSP